MIRLHVEERDGRIRRFTVRGHAGAGPAGRDIVCAAVSALVLNAINSCEVLLGCPLSVHDDGETLECRVPSGVRAPAEVDLLLRSMVFGVQQTADAHPKHVAVLIQS
ncbi:ribosomal-processing cysteine protease Prp [Alicyclobacillus sp.]|uniref:ribosomal-processing cysteine protease Prp n=1 Tax=Alicyclobacillus sp. TaxID=61169 RepID=UPI0025BD10A2|nr:ribosomal-processing cysteine protease Prp [Alicyclobacillus sp.]MCL6516163.1 ribosomal-processing cysteine protease Prp [Alicyclobacillus sp.]